MIVPAGLTEKEVLDAIEGVVRVLAPHFVFGIYDKEDLGQEIRLMCLDTLSRYRPEVGPLQNFLYSHSKRRCTNFVRDHHKRADAPCKKCHRGIPCGPDGEVCQRYAVWKKIQDRKTAVRSPAGFDDTGGEAEWRARDSCDVVQSAELKEMLTRIDTHLDVELRATYLQMRAGKAVPKAKRQVVEAAVREILGACEDLAA